MMKSSFNQIVSQFFSTTPVLFKPIVEQKWNDFLAQNHFSNTFLQKSPEFFPLLLRAWVGSDWLMEISIEQPQLIINVFESKELFLDLKRNEYSCRVQAAIYTCTNQLELMSTLRQLRTQEMVRIAWRALANLTDTEQTLKETSYFADACLSQTLDKLYAWQVAQDGMPTDARGAPQKLFIIAAGKLGGEELNFSSDVDLIFSFGEHGQTQGSARSIENQTFFLRLAQNLIKTLDQKTPEGRVFRVDMRLRPFGDAGALVMSFAAIEAYYQEHGRDWERYAMIKARIVNPDNLHQKNELMQLLQRFSYRRYIDFSVIESLRELKQLIDRQTKKQYLTDDVKRGVGGIRELEFIVQAMQLIRGGKEPYLQHQNFLTALARIALTKSLGEKSIAMIRTNYLALRQIENFLQMFGDKQKHCLPNDAIARERLAIILGESDWHNTESKINKMCDQNRGMFLATVKPTKANLEVADQHKTQLELLRNVWSGLIKKAEALSIVTQLFPEADADLIFTELMNLQSSRATRDSSRYARERLDTIMPYLLFDLLAVDNPSNTLSRLNVLLDAIIRRSVYLSLLLENPNVRQLVMTIISKSAWVSDILTNYPLTLDELISFKPDQVQPDFFLQELQQRVLLADETDQEQQYDILRQFHRGTLLKIAAADCLQKISVSNVQLCLTRLAEIALDNIFQLAWQAVCARLEVPEEFEFAIIAYGKLGSQELAYQSDLDLVFLYDASAAPQTSDAALFALRLAQRIIHMLEMQTLSGKMYPLDLRLRPSGASGPLVSSMSQYANYQQKDAWIWEHQALVRARPVVGKAKICKKFEQLRLATLSQSREDIELRQSVLDMRNKMRKNCTANESGSIDLKNSPGTLIDIEFMVQYWALKWGATEPQCLEVTHTDQILTVLQQNGCISESSYHTLHDAYWYYIEQINQSALHNHSANMMVGREVTMPEYVSAIWQAEMVQVS